VRTETASSDENVESLEEIAAALAAVPDLSAKGPEVERLWFALWNGITTRASVDVQPANSATRIRVTRDFASLELITAWTWLEKHEARARTMEPAVLERTLRNQVTKSHYGSGRAAMDDEVCGITEIPRKIRLTVSDVDTLEIAAS
jgi:hypothetical protein